MCFFVSAAPSSGSTPHHIFFWAVPLACSTHMAGREVRRQLAITKSKNKCSTKALAVECGVGVVWKSKHGVILPMAYASTLACMKK